MNNRDKCVKREDLAIKKSVFPKINKNKETLHNRYKSHHLISTKKPIEEEIKEGEDINEEGKLKNMRMKEEEKIDQFAFKYNPNYEAIYKRLPNVFVNKAKRRENLFGIDHSTDKIPLNHSIELESSFKIKKQNLGVTKSRRKNNSPKTKKPNTSAKKNNNNLYLTDIRSLDQEDLTKRLKDIFSNNNKENKRSQSRNKSSSRAHSSYSSHSGPRSVKDEIKKSGKSSQEKRRGKIKIIPFSSATLRDCGENFILNDNPGVGMYNPNESPYYVKKEFNSNVTKNFEKLKMRKIWTDRYISRGYKHVNFK